MLVAYPQPGKEKSRQVCEAFIIGTGGGKVSSLITTRLHDAGAAVFYGVRPGWAHLWKQARREGRDWWFIDNSYFDSCREKYFRITKNAIQHSGHGESDGTRFRALSIQIKPMRDGGDYDLVCQQSDEFMRVVAEDPDWTKRTIAGLGEVVVRRKSEKRPLSDDLKGARRLYTWSSAAAVTALLSGVPVTTSPQCCAYDVKDRMQWASVLADNQWTLDEIRSGDAWRALNV